MHFDTDGVYTLLYTAEDSCGNETIEERTVEVISLNTVLYTDGAFIINEKSTDRDANVALHGAVANEYYPLDATHNYVFSPTSRPWYEQRASVTSVEIGSPISPTNIAYWFGDFENCTSMDLSLLDTSAVTDMQYLFNDCQALTSLDVSHFDTSNVTNMQYMFCDCYELASLDISNFDTSAVTDMRSMFYDCQTLTTLNVSNFNTSQVTNMQNMFSRCGAITTLDLSSFDTSSVTNMGSMFASCSALETLDLSSFDTSIVTDMSYMFYVCSVLATIYASASFVVDQVTNSMRMFGSMSTNLVGGAGTVWSQYSPVDKTRAKIDGGTSDPGYFTAKA